MNRRLIPFPQSCESPLAPPSPQRPRRRIEFIIVQPRAPLSLPQPSAHLLSLPMRRLLDPRGAVVALWLPNRERHWRFALGPLAEAWGVSPIAQWAWLKTDAAGEPVVDVASAHRRPYEPILVLGNEGAVEWCRGTGGKAAAQGVWEERAREGMRGAGGGGGKGHGGGLEAGAAEEGQGDGGLLKGGHGAGTAEEGQGGEKGTRQEGQSRGKGTSSGEGREERGRVFEGQLPGEGEMPVPTKLLVCPPAQHSRKPYLGFALAGLARGAAETGVNDCGELTSASGEPR